MLQPIYLKRWPFSKCTEKIPPYSSEFKRRIINSTSQGKAFLIFIFSGKLRKPPKISESDSDTYIEYNQEKIPKLALLRNQNSEESEMEITILGIQKNNDSEKDRTRKKL